MENMYELGVLTDNLLMQLPGDVHVVITCETVSFILKSLKKVSLNPVAVISKVCSLKVEAVNICMNH